MIVYLHIFLLQARAIKHLIIRFISYFNSNNTLLFSLSNHRLKGTWCFKLFSKPFLLTLGQFDACICLISTDPYSKFPKIYFIGKKKTNFFSRAGGVSYCVGCTISMNFQSRIIFNELDKNVSIKLALRHEWEISRFVFQDFDSKN